MNALQVAALVAAGFFAVAVCAAVFVLIRLGALIGTAGQLLSEYRARADLLIEAAQRAVDRSNEQLARTDAITANLDQVSVNMAELSTQVSALAGVARGISAGLGTPLTKLAALAFGIRRAVALRHGGQRPVPAAARHAALAGQRPALTGGPDRGRP